MDKTELVKAVANLFTITGHKVSTSVDINFREIDVVAEELHGLVRKVILIECADYSGTVGPDKLMFDLRKLDAAKEKLGHRSVLMHVSQTGYTPKARGYALEHGLDVFTLGELSQRLINFDPYIEAIQSDRLRPVIMREYQPTALTLEPHRGIPLAAIEFLDRWLETGSRWLTILGDYGVGKSWMLRRYLFHLMDRYLTDPAVFPLPFFVPLQHFTKAFDYRNLILATFQRYGLSGVHFSAFEYLAGAGRIVFLYDSFDEMAQVLRAETIRENLKELLSGIASDSRAIMTSRPTYFESRAERLVIVEDGGELAWHSIDEGQHQTQVALSRFVRDRLEASQFARLRDLTVKQRMALFRTVLSDKPAAYAKLIGLFQRFQQLETISQRAVIARLLTTVAETLAGESDETADASELIPNDLDFLNEAKIFQIVIHNLLQRDINVGLLPAADRLRFLRNFAIFLQRPGRPYFADPREVRELVQRLFAHHLRTTDTPAQLLENFYRTCRRHSGLTTEGQFLDTSGNIDTPVDENDTESRVGFSHNSIREFLVADAIADTVLNEVVYHDLFKAVVTDVVGGFLADISEFRPELVTCLKEQYANPTDSAHREWLFRIAFGFVQRTRGKAIFLLGDPPLVDSTDICNLDFSALPLRSARFVDCIAGDSDFRNSDLRGSAFDRTILDRAMFDGASLTGADFRQADLQSIYVFDAFDKKTTAILRGRDARQWLFSRGAYVTPTDDLNPYLGQPWYEAAREVMRTLQTRMAGTHQDSSLARGTDLIYRPFAEDFVSYLMRKNILEKLRPTDPGHLGEWVVRVAPANRKMVNEFADLGRIGEEIAPFFEKYLKKHGVLDRVASE
jgi:hypothetical protein